MLIVAIPQPQIEVVFHLNGKSVPLRIPPTYLHFSVDAVERVLLKILEPNGYKSCKAQVPEKLLAVRSGLAEYGRNNITYIPGMGSFHRLMAFFSDFPDGEDNWQEETILHRCQSCTACLRACPTGAILKDRFLIRADRCLTFINERPGKFPDWLDSSWHHCLVGCMRCQEACPENRDMLGWMVRKGSFTEEETELLLAGGAADDRLSREIRKKLEDLDLIEYKGLMDRNLSAVLRCE
jgi:epoxyqueuosine reductase